MRALGRTIVPCLLAACIALADTPAVTLHIQLETTGVVSVTSAPRQSNLKLAPLIPAVIGCPGRLAGDEEIFGHFRCPGALRRSGLILEGVIDLSPIAQHLSPVDEIELSLSYPRLGFAESSAPLKTESYTRRLYQSGLIPARAEPIHIRFGYPPDAVAWIFAPLLALALAMAAISAFVCRRGLPHLHRSVFILGATLWLSVVWRLQAIEPLRILLAGTPFAVPASTALEFLPPLLCVAAGVGIGSRRSGQFQETFWGYGVFVFPLACALAAVPYLAEEGATMEAALWLIAAAASCIWSYRRIRAIAGSATRQITTGPLRDRVTELAAKAGHRDASLYVSSSTRSQTANAFAIPGSGIILTAPLVALLGKREVDAIVAHELSHFRHRKAGIWVAFILAAMIYSTLIIDLVGGWAFPEAALPLVFLFSLRGARKREFAADAGATALTGDPRAMINGLLRVARNNSQPLDFSAPVEWFSTHPSTRKRIRAIAAAAGIEEVYDCGEPGESYTLPTEDAGAIFSERWQAANGARYGWTIIFAAPAVGVAIALGIAQLPAAGPAHYLGGILFGCVLIKCLTEAAMGWGYARMRRRLTRKLGMDGALVGLAPGDRPRLFGGHRFRDVGLLRFEKGRLCYHSERTSIQLGHDDIVEVKLVPAALAAWFSRMPLVRFRPSPLGEVHAVILHPLDFGAVGKGLFGKIEKWRAEPAAGSGSFRGFEEVAGEPILPVTIPVLVRGFRISGALTLVAAMLAGWPLRADLSGIYALSVAAAAYAAMLLPMVFRRPAPIVVSPQPPKLT